ncbi:MAG: DUF6527 family protein [Magnetospirillum sp.]|nr:DUF6527 family protein [Magnetospirillum sp.]
MSEKLKHRADLNGPWGSTAAEDFDADEHLKRGEFCYHRDEIGVIKWITFWPLDCGTWLTVSILPNRQANGHSWTLTGPEDAPTLHPSVNANGIWHGFLTAGVAKAC